MLIVFYKMTADRIQRKMQNCYILDLFIRPKKIIVWLSSTTFFEKGRASGFFFSESKSKLRIIASISPNKGANKSTLPKNIFIQV